MPRDRSGPDREDTPMASLAGLKQEVQTLIRLGVEFTTVRTRWMLGLKRRRVRLRDQGTLLPKRGFLPQMSQTAATAHTPKGCREGSSAARIAPSSARSVMRATWEGYPMGRNEANSATTCRGYDPSAGRTTLTQHRQSRG